MSYTINGVEKEVDDYGYLLEPDYSEEAAQVIAAACGIALTEQHWKVCLLYTSTSQNPPSFPRTRESRRVLLDSGSSPE